MDDFDNFINLKESTVTAVISAATLGGDIMAHGVPQWSA